MKKQAEDRGFAADWCVHFRSMAHNDRCGKDISYTDLNGGTEYRRMHNLPCFIKRDSMSSDRIHCEYFTAPTVEEVALNKDWNDARQTLLKSVLADIAPWREKYQGVSHEEILKCPACRGRLHLSANRRGDITGHCEGAGCVSFKVQHKL